MELESKFIEGTNEQYSIRNDGVVIRHCRLGYDINSKKNTIFYKDVILTPSIDKKKNAVLLYVKIGDKKKVMYVRKIVADTFNLPNPYINTGPCVTIAHKDNNPLNCSLNNLYYVGRGGITLSTSIEEKLEKERFQSRSQKAKSYRNLSAEKRAKRNEYQKRWEKENTDKLLPMKKKSNARVIKDLDKSYVAAKLKLPVSLLTEELYQRKKALIMIKRALIEKNK